MEHILDESVSKEIWRKWVRLRVDSILEHVTAHDVLLRNGVPLRGIGEEQLSCPFHGIDSKPSARVYPANPNGKSKVWCFVCQESWDAVALWRKFQQDDTKSFSRVLRDMESAFGLSTPEMPEGLTFENPSIAINQKSLDNFKRLYEASENRLRQVRDDYYQLDDMKGYLTAGSVLDRVHHRISKNSMEPDEGSELLRKLLDRIAAKVRKNENLIYRR